MWQIGTAANLVVAIAFFGIAAAIAVPLLRSNQFIVNGLATLTSFIFVTCAVPQGVDAARGLGVLAGIDVFGPPPRATVLGVTGDVLAAAAALAYWWLRVRHASSMRGAVLFEDLRAKQRQALEINDTIVQGLAVAKLALEFGDEERSRRALERSLDSARAIITGLMREGRANGWAAEDAPVRSRAAVLDGKA